MSSRITTVVLDAMGVIYEAGDDVGGVLLPFLRARGCTLPESVLKELYIRCSLGEMPSQEFWQATGLEEAGAYLDGEYVKLHRLNPGLMTFVHRMAEVGMALFCLSNDVVEWSAGLRTRFSLEEHFQGWVVSGEVGVRKPAREIYLRLLETVAREPSECLFVDDTVANLVPAQDLGMQTLLFKPAGTAPDASGFTIAFSFNDVERWVLGNT